VTSDQFPLLSRRGPGPRADHSAAGRRPAVRTRLACLCCLAGLAVAGGCATDQAKDVRSYRDVLSLGEAATLTKGEPLSLATAVRLTNDTNESLSIEGENYLQAIIDRKRAVANFLPTLDLIPALIFRDGTSSTAPGLADKTQFDATLSGQVTLFDGFRNINRLKASDLTIEQRRWLLLDLREALLLDVAQVYYRVLRAEQLTVVLENSVTLQEERVRDIRARQRIGVARPLDVAQTEAQFSQTRVLLVNARNAVRTGRAALSFLTGVNVQGSPLTDGFALPETPPTLDDLVAMATERRQDLAAAAAAAEAARRDVDVAIGQYAPSVSLNLDYFLARDSLPTDRDWTGLLQVNVPIFAAGRIEADVDAAWSRFRQTVLAYSLLKRQIRQDVEVSYENVQASITRMKELKDQMRAAQEAIRQAESAYNNGLGTNLERITAQDQFLSAQLQLTSEEFDQKVFYLTAYRALGAITEGTAGVTVPPQPPQRPAPESPFVKIPG
jgi:outer membrane protein TolC